MRRSAYILSTVVVTLVCAVGWVSAGGALTGGGAGTTITFSIAVADEEKPAIQQLLTRFEERARSGPSLDRVARFRDQPGIRVKLVTGLRGDDLVDRLRRDQKRRDPGIQLFAQDNLALWPLVSEHLVQDVSDVAVPAEVTGSLRPRQFGQGAFFLPFRPNVRLTYASKECLTTSQLAERGVLPGFSVSAGWGRHVIGGDVLGIPSGVTGNERRAAVALVEYLMSRDAQELLASQNTWPSIREDAYATAPKGQAETFHAIAEALRDGWYRPQDIPYWPAVSKQMNEALDRVIRMEPVEQVLPELHDRIAQAAREQGAVYPPAG